MTDDEWLLVQKVAATGARACDIIAAADKLALMAERVLGGDLDNRSIGYVEWRLRAMREALEAFKVVRQGQ